MLAPRSRPTDASSQKPAHGSRPGVTYGSAVPALPTPRSRGSVGSVGLVPPQPLAVLAPLRASALARIGASGSRRMSGRHEVARGEPAAGRQRAPAGLTGLAHTSRAAGHPAGSGMGKRASATPAEAANSGGAKLPRANGEAVSASERAGATAALARGGVGTRAPRWNHHARTPGPTVGTWRTSEGRGRSAVPGRRKHWTERAKRAREARSESRRPERPRASVASPSPSHTPELQSNLANSGKNTRTNTEVNT
jgi:hypothetical protein